MDSDRLRGRETAAQGDRREGRDDGSHRRMSGVLAMADGEGLRAQPSALSPSALDAILRYFPQFQSLIDSGGCEPTPEVAVAVAPTLSVTVSVTASGCATPSSLPPLAPSGESHVSENDSVALESERSMVTTVPCVYSTCQV